MGFLVIFAGVLLTGAVLYKLFSEKICTTFSFPYIFILGSFTSIPLLYFIRAYLTLTLSAAILLWLVIILISSIVFAKYKRIDNIFSKKQIYYFGLYICILGISYVLFHKSFSYKDFNFLIATNMYLDMGAHIPFIRSFSSDINFPFEIPFFAPSNIPYHFMFNFYTGVLEYLGLRVDVGYNILSSLTLASIFFIFIDFGKALFKKSVFIGLLAFFLFLSPFNYSFFTSMEGGISSAWKNQQYDFTTLLGDNTAGNFLYINTYLNQRHLLFSLSVALVLIMIAYKSLIDISILSKKFWIALGLLAGLMYLWNMSVFVMLALVFLMFYLLLRKKELIILGCCIIFLGLVQMLPFINSDTTVVKFVPGYLVHSNLTIDRFTLFWVFNLGISIATLIGGFIISKKTQKILFLSLLPIFIIPNLFQLTHEMFDNHKFFNFWYMFMCFYSASFIVFLFKNGFFLRVAGTLIVVLSIATSITNYAVVKNDMYAQISDYKTYPMMIFALKNIPSQSTILTNGEIYDPISITGMKSFLGRSHYVYLYGGDPQERLITKKQILEAPESTDAKKLLQKFHIDYIFIYKNVDVKNLQPVDYRLWGDIYEKIYEDDFGIIYET